MRTRRLLAIAPLALVLAVLSGPRAEAQNLVFSLFERYLESLRQQARIPGLSVAIVHQRQIVWERGLGFQDAENAIVARPDTPYPIADLSQTFAATLLLQCVERTTLDLNSPVRNWVSDFEPGVSVRRVLAHASDASSTGFRYDPQRFTALTEIVPVCWRSRSYTKAVADGILSRLAMIDSVPGIDLRQQDSPARGFFDQATLGRYTSALNRLAVPYTRDRRGLPVRAEHADTAVNAATGLVSTVRDLAKYDAALDDGLLLTAASRGESWTNARVGARTLPTGLGWFVQGYNGEPLVWHFGLTHGASSLILKVPRRDATLILLANSDGLSAPFPVTDGDITVSVFAKLFLRLFVDEAPASSSVGLTP